MKRSVDAAFTSVAIIGAGALGTALARRMTERGYSVDAVISRRMTSAQALADRVRAAVASTTLADVPSLVRVVVVCVPDDAVSPLAEELSTVPHDWATTIVGHTSGVRTADALAPLAEAGAATLSFHPLQTFTIDSDPSSFEGVYVGVEGDDLAVEYGKQLARDLGARPIVLSPAAKARYHMAASLASNGLVALMGVVSEMLASIPIDSVSAVKLIQPLVERTWAHIIDTSPEEALTGPVVRGDQSTLQRHSEALEAHFPHLAPAYVALATEMVRLAVRSGRLDAERAETLLDMLHEIIVENTPR